MSDTDTVFTDAQLVQSMLPLGQRDASSGEYVSAARALVDDPESPVTLTYVFSDDLLGEPELQWCDPDEEVSRIAAKYLGAQPDPQGGSPPS